MQHADVCEGLSPELRNHALRNFGYCGILEQSAGRIGRLMKDLQSACEPVPENGVMYTCLCKLHFSQTSCHWKALLMLYQVSNAAETYLCAISLENATTHELLILSRKSQPSARQDSPVAVVPFRAPLARRVRHYVFHHYSFRYSL